MCVKSSLESTNGTQVSRCVSLLGRVQLQIAVLLGWYDVAQACSINVTVAYLQGLVTKSVFCKFTHS